MDSHPETQPVRSDTGPCGDMFEWLQVLGAIPAEQLAGAEPLNQNSGSVEKRSSKFSFVSCYLPFLPQIPWRGSTACHIRVCSDSASALTAPPDAGQPGKNTHAPERGTFECKLAARKGPAES